MDSFASNVIYMDKRAARDRYATSGGYLRLDVPTFVGESPAPLEVEDQEVQLNINTLLSVFSEVYVCTTGAACIAKIRELNAAIITDHKPTLAIIEISSDPDSQRRRDRHARSTPSPTTMDSPREPAVSTGQEDLYSLQLLQHISNEIAFANFSELTVPIAMIKNSQGLMTTDSFQSIGYLPRSSRNSSRRAHDGIDPQFDREIHGPGAPVNRTRMMKCFEIGAIDVLTSPLDESRVTGLIAHAYRAHNRYTRNQAEFLAAMRLKKQSWVGLDREAPYAYLRESMVSQLMTSICKPESILQSYGSRSLYILDYHQEFTITKAIASWDFPAHDFSEDELVHAAFLMLQHALRMPELGKWRIPADELKDFLMACRAAYNSFVLYHNFRHVVDVLQAVFYFLLQLGTLPPYPTDSVAPVADSPASPIAALLRPFDALTLLISAIGHDVGHPGVNNAFLVALRAPLAQLYNDNSVLEAFHCAAYSQILRRYWGLAFEDNDLRRLLIKSILATDMGVHFKYMADLGNLQEKLHHNKGTDGWSPQILEEYKTLACGLLIKCADISNVARPFDVAAKWSDVLQLEFARQGEMEKDVGIPTTLFGGPPELGNMTKLANSQIGFMNIYASPLFEAVTDILPGMKFAVKEIKINQAIWTAKINEEKAKEETVFEATKYSIDGFQSPRSGSPNHFFAASADTSHPEGLPASGSSPSLSPDPLISTSQSIPGFSTPQMLPEASTVLKSRATLDSQSHDPSQRFSSVNQMVNSTSSVQPPISSSRRSSGAYPAANILAPGSSSKRSSNSVPTQLHLGFGSSSGDLTPASAENTQPISNATDSAFLSSLTKTKQGSSSSASSYRGSASTGAAGACDSAHRGSKSSDGDNGTSYPIHLSAYQASHFYPGRQPTQPTQPSSGRYSTLSSQKRSSTATSGAHTVASHVLPTSPTETQATSFLSDTSDIGNSDGGTSLTLEVMDFEQPGSGSRFPHGLEDDHSVNEVITITPHMNGHAPVGGERTLRKKNSRFRFDFWKKKYKEGSTRSPSP
ncbi:3',5'-cyclic-nucleotide phosphodiesterase [Xylographa opegraphella]|nr:3',5'-cyclic-nucleotide phosphodiesterase [Xylographa opegraphella]